MKEADRENPQNKQRFADVFFFPNFCHNAVEKCYLYRVLLSQGTIFGCSKTTLERFLNLENSFAYAGNSMKVVHMKAYTFQMTVKYENVQMFSLLRTQGNHSMT